MSGAERNHSQADETPARILEIGETGLFHWAMRQRTDAYYASYRADLRADRPYLGFRAFFRILRRLAVDDHGLIVLHPPFYPGWHPRSFLAAFKYSLFRGRPGELYGAMISPLLFQLLRFVRMRRMIAIDRSDSFGVPSHHFFLLDKAIGYYKRELPLDRWQVFYGSAHRRLPGRSFRLKRKWIRRISRLRPISLGIAAWQIEAAALAHGAPKKTDVFFAGAVEGNSWLRSQVPALLDRLAEAGIRVDAPAGRLSREDFMRRCAESWITLSPAGLGWDCYRHMEAALAGSVPLVSAPTIERYRPLVTGEHCLAYHPDEDRILRIVTDALADKARLQRMAEAARQHVLDHLTETAICRQLLRENSATPDNRVVVASPPGGTTI